MSIAGVAKQVGMVSAPLALIAFWLDQSASLAWRIGLVAAAIAVWRTSGWRVSLPLVVVGWALSESHFPPLGEVAGLALLIAVWMHLRAESPPLRTL